MKTARLSSSAIRLDLSCSWVQGGYNIKKKRKEQQKTTQQLKQNKFFLSSIRSLRNRLSYEDTWVCVLQRPKLLLSCCSSILSTLPHGPSSCSDSYHCIYIPVSGKWVLGHHFCIPVSRKWEWLIRVGKDFYPFKETSAFILLARPESHGSS